MERFKVTGSYVTRTEYTFEVEAEELAEIVARLEQPAEDGRCLMEEELDRAVEEGRASRAELEELEWSVSDASGEQLIDRGRVLD